jgi:hypothetical protein
VIKAGEPWGEAVTGPPDLEVVGSDSDLARVIPTHRGALVRFRAAPESDFARSLGIHADGEPTGVAAPIDVIELEPGGIAVNGVVLGTPVGRIRATTPSRRVQVRVNGREIATGRATTVVIANGQFFDHLDVVPRGHPGDGRIEVQVYALHRGERRAMRARAPRGAHVPHPRITTTTGRAVEVHVEGGRLPLEIDGIAREPVSDLTARVLPGVLRLML